MTVEEWRSLQVNQIIQRKRTGDKYVINEIIPRANGSIGVFARLASDVNTIAYIWESSIDDFKLPT